MRGLVCLWMVLVLGAAGPAVAAKKKSGKSVDSTPPRLTHAPVVTHVRGAPLLIEAEIVDESGVFEPALLVRARGGAEAGTFQRLPLAEVPGTPGRFAAHVPEALLGGEGVDYVIEAFDVEGNGPVRAGEMAAPLSVTFVAAAPVAPPPPAPPPPEPPPPAADVESDNTGLIVGSVVGVSVVVALAAAAGTAAAVYFLRDPAPQTVRVEVLGSSPFAGARP